MNNIISRKQKKIIHAAKSQTIGIISGKKGEGVTTMSIAMATYLSGVKMKKAAIVEFCGNGDIKKIAKTYFACEKDKFSIFNVDYYSVKNKEKLSLIYNEDYEFIIVDFGSFYKKNIGEFIRCQIKIVMGSVNIWRFQEYLEVCQFIKEIPGSKKWLHILSGDELDIKSCLKGKAITGVNRISINDPYVVENKHVEFFQSMI